MENILTVIGSTKLQGVLSPYDGLSIGIISALTSGGYSASDLPVVTGQDAEVGSIKSIIAGEQYSTIFKDTRELAKQAVTMVDDIRKVRPPRSTTKRPTTTARRSSRRTCSSRRS